MVMHGKKPEAFCSLGIPWQPLLTGYLKTGKEVDHTGKESSLKEIALVSVF